MVCNCSGKIKDWYDQNNVPASNRQLFKSDFWKPAFLWKNIITDLRKKVIIAELYEKLLDDVMRILNGKKNIIGHTWNRQLLRHIYSFTLLEYNHEAGAVIGMRRLA